MSALRIVGGRDAEGTRVEVAIADGVVVPDAPPGADVLDATGAIVVPGLIDAQVNGAGGWDLTDEPERLWDVAAVLPRFGVTAFVPTIISSSPETRARALHALAAGPPPGWSGAVPLGLHFEGPFLAPSRRGAHPQRWLSAPSSEIVADWSPDRGVLMVTLAPELDGALDLVRELASRGIVVSVGHTEATADQVDAAVAAGARALTHLGNTMPGLLAREPGPMGAAFAASKVVGGVIADGVHLDPHTLRTMWRALGPDRLLLVTDTTAALGVADGPSRLGDQDVLVQDGTVRLPDGTLAGSAASLSRCLRTLVRDAGASRAEAVTACTTVPARLVGDPARGSLSPGSRGDVTLLDDDLEPVATVVFGDVVARRS